MHTITQIGFAAMVCLLTLCSANKNNYAVQFTDQDPFAAEWKIVDSLDNQQLPKQALAQVIEILGRAKQAEDADQIIKAYIYRAKYTQALNEEGAAEAILELEGELSGAKGLTKNLLASILAETYQNYYQSQQWIINQRTELAEPTADFKTWTARQFLKKAKELYLESLDKPESLRAPISDLEFILHKNFNAPQVQPTVYDFLASRAIAFFNNYNNLITESVRAFVLDNPVAFGLPGEFANADFNTEGSEAGVGQALHLYQELTQFHLNDGNSAALIDLSRKRLEFVRQQGVMEGRDKLYREALEKLAEQYKGQAEIGYVMLDLAKYYKQGGDKENSNKDKEHPNSYKKALETISNIEQSFKDASILAQAEILRKQILQPNLRLMVESVIPANGPTLAMVTIRNINELHWKLVKLDAGIKQSIKDSRRDKLINVLNRMDPLTTWADNLSYSEDHFTRTFETNFAGMEFGEYVLLVSTSEKINSSSSYQFAYFQVTDMALVQVNTKKPPYNFIVTDRNSGKPLPGVDMELKSRRGGSKNFTSDNQGMFAIGTMQDRNYELVLRKGNDVFRPDGSVYFQRPYTEPQGNQQVHFFLDRKIYRPQQTIYYKGIALNYDGERKPSLLTNKKVTVVYSNPNGEKIEEVTFTTNEFGSFHGSFTAPAGGLLGSFNIRAVNGGAINFNIEEYKRPKFEVTIKNTEGETTLNELINIKGSAKALAGYAIDQADVNYRITRQARFPWCPWWRIPSYYNQNEAEIAFGKVETNADGEFEFSFIAKPDATIKSEDRPEFIYRVSVDVTDGNGETRSNQTIVKAGYIGYTLSHNLGSILDVKEFEGLKVEAKNLSGQPAQIDAEVKLFPLRKPQQYFLPRYWKVPDLYRLDKTAFKKSFPLYAYGDEELTHNWEKENATLSEAWENSSSGEYAIDKSKLKPGQYIIELTGTDDNGKVAKKIDVLQIINSEKMENPGSAISFAHSDKSEWQPGESFDLSISAFEPIHVFYQFSRNNRRLNGGWMDLNKLVNVKKEIGEDLRGGLNLFYVFVLNNRLVKEYRSISVPWKNKELTIETSTFREKLKPGDEESWTVKIKGPRGEALAAELLAGMYDASLDAFAANSYSLNPWPNYYSYITDRPFGFKAQWGRGYQLSQNYPGNIRNRIYSNLNWFGFHPQRAGFFGRSRVDGIVMMESQSVPSAPKKRSAAPPGDRRKSEMQNMDMEAAEASLVMDESDGNAGMQDAATTSQTDDPVRTNLDETVFFMPDLRTDAEGNVSFSFTMNEALTKWKYLLFAHSKDLSTAALSKEVITQKELMVVPNPPRFFREGDKMSFSGKVVNLSEKTLSGEVSLDFADASTQEVVDIFTNSNVNQSFSIEPGQSQSFYWELNIPFEKYQALTHTMRAKAAAFSDGERADLPVLTNRMMVTEALPLPVKSNETKTFDFSRMQEVTASPSASLKQFSLEYTSNPAWYAVMALPYLMEYPHQCSEQIFSRYYANQLAASIANANPKIKTVFEKWKNTDALLSNLSKNQELKTAILEETPWVMQALSEEEQKKNIGILFDLMRLAKESSKAIDQLVAKQNGDGGFGWFSGGKSNPYITQHILSGFGHLEKLQVINIPDNNKLNKMVRSAIQFTDHSFLERFLELKKRTEKNGGKLDPAKDYLSPGIIQYFYMRSFFKNQLPIPKNEAYNFYYPQLAKFWTKRRLINQAQIALIAHRDSENDLAKNILTSFRERALHHDELGMYWKYGGGYYWYDQPIETHSFMIECFNEIDARVNEIDDLKVWLLKNKQTNRWETTKSTSLAIYALLITGDQGVRVLNTDQLVNIKVGSYSLSPASAEAGTGYFKQNWDAGEIPGQAQKITVGNPNANIAWGAAYIQYFEDLDKITSYKETPLTIDRQVYKETPTGEGPQLRALQAGTKLNAGDRIKVRIEIRVDRDMEFVHLKDGRGAGFEPENVLSGYRWQGRLGYYESTRDASTNFFIDYLPKGTHVFEYPLRAVHSGDFSAGITTLQSMYAPEYTTHSEGVRLIVE